MRAITVSVDYADILRLTLPWNRRHFDEVWVVTTPQDHATIEVAAENHCHVYKTEAFYSDGADFRKWLALEEGLAAMGRCGWLCVLDSDILWPRTVTCIEVDSASAAGDDKALILRNGCLSTPLQIGQLCTPIRRMWDSWPTVPAGVTVDQAAGGVPPETEWGKFPLHPQQTEYAGYTQLFHCADQVLAKKPWYDTSWRHCGGADSFFQQRWSTSCKVRPPFEVLHLGPSGRNWAGRATQYADGTRHPDSHSRLQKVNNYIRGRTRGPDRFDREKILPVSPG